MRRLLLAFLLLPSLAFGQSAAQRLSQVGHVLNTGSPAASALGGTETIPCVQGGVTSACTPAQIKTYVGASSGTVTTTGTPANGNIAQFSGATSITNAATTGTGSVVLATSPTISNLTVTGTCTGCGSGGSITLQHDGTNNASQTALNLQSGQGIAVTNPSAGNVSIASTVPQRTVTTSPTVASTDMGGLIVMNVTGGGTLTVPAISSTVLASGMSVGIVNYSASTAAVSTTPTINSGGGCVTATGIPSGDSWQLFSNGTTLDCVQTVSASSGGGIANQMIGVSSGFLTPSGTQYQGFFAGGLGGGAPSQEAPRSGTVANLYVTGPTLAAATSFQVTLTDNGTSEAVTCTIAASTNSCTDLTHTFTFAAGDKLYWTTVQTGTGTAGTYAFSYTVQ